MKLSGWLLCFWVVGMSASMLAGTILPYQGMALGVLGLACGGVMIYEVFRAEKKHPNA